MEKSHVFKCEFGTVIAYGTVNQRLLVEGCRKAVLMDMKSKEPKEGRGNAA